MAVICRLISIVVLLIASSGSLADDERAHVNYMLHCQGCHLPQTEGFAGKVPVMKNFVGYFTHSQVGREFLIRVPGVAHAALADDEIAELMNWLLNTYSSAQLPAAFEPYTEAEVAALRPRAERDPNARRVEILRDIASDLPSLARALANERN